MKKASHFLYDAFRFLDMKMQLMFPQNQFSVVYRRKVLAIQIWLTIKWEHGICYSFFTTNNGSVESLFNTI